MKKLLPLLLLLFAFQVFAEEVRTFDLQHRSAAEVIPILRPMLDPGAGISGTGYTLIIRSSAANLKQLEPVIQRIDKAPKMLMISVDQNAERDRSGSGVSVTGNPDRHTDIRVYSTQRSGGDSGVQHLQVMEGHWATIRAGEAIPQVTRRYQQGPGGSSVEQSIEYRDVDTGFEVRPRVSGGRVTLDIRPFRATPSERGGGAIEQQAIATTISGHLGDWIDLGGVSERRKENGQGLIYSTKARGQHTRNVRIKVELIEP